MVRRIPARLLVRSSPLMARKPNDDLFEGSTMTFGEHLEELRVCLFRGVVGLGIGCVVGFFIANAVVNFFQSPLERAMIRYYLKKVIGDNPDMAVEEARLALDQGLVREKILIEAGQASAALRQAYPESFPQLHLTPYWFTDGDLLEGGARTIATKLVAAGQSQSTSPAKAVWQQLSSAEQKQIETLAKVESPFTTDQTSQLLGILNSVAGKPALHEAPELAHFTGPDNDAAAAAESPMERFAAWVSSLLFGDSIAKKDTVAELRMELADKPNAETSRRLNKLLLARTFPAALQKARVSLLAFHTWKPVKVRFQVLSAEEAFMIWLKAALVAGLVIASPYLIYQIWVFVAAGLYPHEKSYVYLYLPMSLLLFFGGASLAFLFVFDPVLDFLFTFNRGMNADFDPRIGEWLGFVLILPIGFGLGFQLPLVMVFINRIGLVSVETYIGQWRIAILTIFIVAMILTPADPISMMLMAGPLCLLYLLGIVMCKYMPKGRNPFDEAYEP
jgi:sec-independent protein translocase protein TatC